MKHKVQSRAEWEYMT